MSEITSEIREKEGSVTNPADTIDPEHHFTDTSGRHWYRHMNGAIYCDGSRVLQIFGKVLEVTATDSLMIVTAGQLHEQWNAP